MTRAQLHAQLYRWQQRYLGWLPYPVIEMLAGLLVLPLLWWLGAWGVFLFIVGSEAYERALPPYKFADVFWRAAGGVLVYIGWLFW